MDNTLLTVIGGIIILALISIALVVRFKTKPSTFDKEAAENFLKGLSDNIYDEIIHIVNDFDLSEFDSIEGFEAHVLFNIYDAAWEYISDELEEAAKTDILTAMALKVLNREFVEKFIDKLVEKYDISEKITQVWNRNFEEKVAAELVAKDEQLQLEFASDSYVEENGENHLVAAVEVVPTEEELSVLNPPTEEEKEYNPEEDSSVEVIEEETFIDSRGRRRSRKTGRYV